MRLVACKYPLPAGAAMQPAVAPQFTSRPDGVVVDDLGEALVFVEARSSVWVSASEADAGPLVGAPRSPTVLPEQPELLQPAG